MNNCMTTAEKLLIVVIKTDQETTLHSTHIIELACMAISQRKAKTKSTGGIYTTKESKKKAHVGRVPTLTKLDERKMQTARSVGGHQKNRLLRSNLANVYDPKAKTHKKVKILNSGRSIIKHVPHAQVRKMVKEGLFIATTIRFR